MIVPGCPPARSRLERASPPCARLSKSHTLRLSHRHSQTTCTMSSILTGSLNRNFVLFLGACMSEDGRMCVLSEYMEAGTVEDYFRDQTLNHGAQFAAPNELVLSWAQDRKFDLERSLRCAVCDAACSCSAALVITSLFFWAVCSTEMLPVVLLLLAEEIYRLWIICSKRAVVEKGEFFIAHQHSSNADDEFGVFTRT